MNRRHLIKTIALTALGGALASSDARAADGGSAKSKPLRVRETLKHDDDLSIRFIRVKKDNRCPINARCKDPGDAEVLLRVKVSGRQARVVSLHTDDEPNFLVFSVKYPEGMFGIPKSYVISIESLDPRPSTGKKTKQSEYRLRLKIEEAV